MKWCNKSRQSEKTLVYFLYDKTEPKKLIIMGRPKGTKNTMRTSIEKERILNENLINHELLGYITPNQNYNNYITNLAMA